MSITTAAAAGVLDNFATRLGQVADAKPAADEFLAVLAKETGNAPAPVLLGHGDIASVPELRLAWTELHEAVRAAVLTADGAAPAFGTAGVTDAKELVRRLAGAEASMSLMEANPGIVRDVSGIAYAVRSRVDDIVGRGQDGVAAEARMLHAIDG